MSYVADEDESRPEKKSEVTHGTRPLYIRTVSIDLGDVSEIAGGDVRCYWLRL